MDIVLDPNVSGRAYYCSDMEGLSRTDDHGQTWRHVSGNMSFCNVLTVAIEKGCSDHIYAGTLGTFELSRDGGETWRVHGDVQLPIGRIAIHPKNSERVILAPSNHMRWSERPNLPGPIGDVGVYVSNDRGKSFRFVPFPCEKGRRDVYDVCADPINENIWYAAAEAGLFKTIDGGESWKRVLQPMKTRGAWGCALTPDGRALYVVFQVYGEATTQKLLPTQQGDRCPTKLYLIPVGEQQWIDLSLPAFGFESEGTGDWAGKHRVFWRPEIDPRSDEKQHRLLTASHSDRSGLYRVKVNFESGKFSSAKWERVFYFANDGVGAEYDIGWENYSTRPLAWSYVPHSWDSRSKVWTTGDQTLYRSDKNMTLQGWTQIYTDYVKTLEGQRFYRSKGVQCTFVFDSHGMDDYVVQSNGDNAVIESYDFGQSWSVGIRMPRSNAVEIVDTVDPPIVLAHISSGYGADSDKGMLYAKVLKHRSPKDRWRLVGGSSENIGNLPYHSLYEQVVKDPHAKGRVFVGTQRRGIYVIENLETFLMNPKKHRAYRISAIRGEGPRRVNDKTQGLVVHPKKQGVIFVAENSLVWRGRERASGAWEWRIVAENTGHEMSVWEHDGTVYLAVTEILANGDRLIKCSMDEGNSWKRVMNFEHDIRPLKQHPWYKNMKVSMSVRGLLGYKNKLFASVYEWESGKSYGVFCGTFLKDGVEWRDITGDHDYPCPVKCRVVEARGSTWLQMSTKGAGLWRTNIENL